MALVLFYDCEIRKLIPSKAPRRAGYSYCEGWGDFVGMGISIVGWREGRYYPPEAGVPDSTPFIQWDVPRWALGNARGLELFSSAARKAEIITSFNGKRFDDKLMAASGINIATDYDLLEEVRQAAYGSSTHKGMPPGRRYGLGLLGEANGCPKTGDGAEAPIWWQDGRAQDVAEYCCGDVESSTHVLDLGLKGELVDPNTQTMLTLRGLTEAPGWIPGLAA